MNGKGILSAGRLYCDLNFSGICRMPELGQEVFADELSLHAGGGAFITAWLDNRQLQTCLTLGNHCGAIAVTRRGGASDLPDLQYLLQEYTGDSPEHTHSMETTRRLHT